MSTLSIHLEKLRKEVNDKEMIKDIKALIKLLESRFPLSDDAQRLMNSILQQSVSIKLTSKVTNALIPIIDTLYVSNKTMKAFLTQVFTIFLPQPVLYVINMCRIETKHARM